MKEDIGFSVRFVWYSLLAAVVFGAIGFGIYFMQPSWLGLERENFVKSHQYIEGKRGLLLKLTTEYDENNTEIERFQANDPVKFKDVIKGLKVQQQSLYARIRDESQLLPEMEVPERARSIVLANKR